MLAFDECFTDPEPSRPAAKRKAPAGREAESAFGMGSRMAIGTVLALALLAGCGGWAAMAHLDRGGDC